MAFEKWTYAHSAFVLVLILVIGAFITLVVLGATGHFSDESTVTITSGQSMLDLKLMVDNTRFIQNTPEIMTLCLSSHLPASRKFFEIQTNNQGIFFINNGPIQYTGPVYLQPNKSYRFSVFPSQGGEVWNLLCFVPPPSISTSPTLSWMNFVAPKMTFAPPKTARKLAELSLAMYQSVVQFQQFPSMNLLAIINEAGQIWTANQLPDLKTDTVYNTFPKLEPSDKKLVSDYVNQLIDSLAYPSLAEDPTYAGAAPTTVAPFLWIGVKPILPNWSNVPYLANTYQTLPGTSTGSIPQDAKDLQVLLTNRTEAQTQIGLYFKGAPPPQLTQIYSEFLGSEQFPEKNIVQVMALLQMALSDAGVYAWATKYTYWIIRPFQYIPSLISLFPTPNFPGFISGHSTFSGAIGTLFGLLVPKYAAIGRHIAQTAADSREYAGIHFHSDDHVGLISGTQIGASIRQSTLEKVQNYLNFV